MSQQNPLYNYHKLIKMLLNSLNKNYKLKNKMNNPVNKWAKGLNRQVLKEEVQMAEKIFNLFSHQEKANQNYTEIASHPSQNGDHQENEQEHILVRMEGKGPYPLVMGM
jgi:hypothetical protein